MRIYVDADSCPVSVRSIVQRAVVRREILCYFVADRPLALEKHRNIRFIKVDPGEDAVDNFITDIAKAGDLVITRDIPFAARLVEHDIFVLTDRGDVFNRENIRERLSTRDLMMQYREFVPPEKRDKPFGEKEKKAFADAFDKFLTAAEKTD